MSIIGREPEGEWPVQNVLQWRDIMSATVPGLGQGQGQGLGALHGLTSSHPAIARSSATSAGRSCSGQRQVGTPGSSSQTHHVPASAPRSRNPSLLRPLQRIEEAYDPHPPAVIAPVRERKERDSDQKDNGRVNLVASRQTGRTPPRPLPEVQRHEIYVAGAAVAPKQTGGVPPQPSPLQVPWRESYEGGAAVAPKHTTRAPPRPSLLQVQWRETYGGAAAAAPKQTGKAPPRPLPEAQRYEIHVAGAAAAPKQTGKVPLRPPLDAQRHETYKVGAAVAPKNTTVPPRPLPEVQRHEIHVAGAAVAPKHTTSAPPHPFPEAQRHEIHISGAAVAPKHTTSALPHPFPEAQRHEIHISGVAVVLGQSDNVLPQGSFTETQQHEIQKYVEAVEAAFGQTDKVPLRPPHDAQQYETDISLVAVALGQTGDVRPQRSFTEAQRLEIQEYVEEVAAALGQTGKVPPRPPHDAQQYETDISVVAVALGQIGNVRLQRSFTEAQRLEIQKYVRECNAALGY